MAKKKKKGKGGYLIALLALSVTLGLTQCSGSNLSKALDIANVSSESRAVAVPIYDAVIKVHPELKEDIIKFDAAWRDANLAVKYTIAAIQAGSQPERDLREILKPILDVLDQFKVEEKVPELKPVITLLRGLLGVR